jgi:hypothetical protein
MALRSESAERDNVSGLYVVLAQILQNNIGSRYERAKYNYWIATLIQVGAALPHRNSSVQDAIENAIIVVVEAKELVVTSGAWYTSIASGPIHAKRVVTIRGFSLEFDLLSPTSRD